METRKRGGKGIGLVLIILLFLGTVANAELITIAIEATINIVEDDGNYLGGNISVGDTITGYYTYESTATDSRLEDSIGWYEFSGYPCGIFLTVGGISFLTDLCDIDFLVSIADNYYSCDNYLLLSYNNISSIGTSPDFISWQLDDYSEAALQNDSLPVTAPILNQWGDSNHLNIEADRMYRIDATVTSAYVIPEPVTIMLLLSGSLFLGKKS